MDFYRWWETVESEYKDVVTEDVARAAFKAGMLYSADIAEDEYDVEDCSYKQQAYYISNEIRYQEKLIN
jgi:hypothetical protein